MENNGITKNKENKNKNKDRMDTEVILKIVDVIQKKTTKNVNRKFILTK